MADWACLSDEKFQKLCSWINEFETIVNEEEADYEMDPPTTQISPTKEISESNKLVAPTVARRRGRPPKNRKVSNVEKLTSMKKKGKK